MARFLETFCVQSKGEWAGTPIALGDWQRELLDDMFELDPETHLRKYRIAVIGMPRKNGKSTLLAGLGLFFLLMDRERGAEVYAAAGDRKQASIIFSESKRMITASPELRPMLTPRMHHIEGPDNAIYRVLSADAALQQGLNPSAVLFDELHVQPNGDLWDALTLGSGTRRQPFFVAITTAGFDEESLCFRLYEYGRKVNRGEVDDPSFFFRWWEPPKGADHRKRSTWIAANPALNPALGKPFLKEDDFTAAVRTTPESAFRRFRCNQWVQAESLWLPPGTWEACRSDRRLDPKLPLAVGIDLARIHDTTAVVAAQKQPDGVVVVRARFWANPYPEKDSRHDEWRLDWRAVTEHLVALYREFPRRWRRPAGTGWEYINGPIYCVDPWGFTDERRWDLEDVGLTVAEVPQSDARLVPPARLLYDLVTAGQLAHDGDETLADHIRSVVAKERGTSWRISKQVTNRKIDGAMALLFALTELPDPSQPKTVGAFLA
ncbi:MAG: hypothetical protein NVS9B1_27460 [Candidatus Dormibacteraceae bacterium]